MHSIMSCSKQAIFRYIQWGIFKRLFGISPIPAGLVREDAGASGNDHKLNGSKPKCFCNTKTFVHGGEDKKCRLYDNQGVLRHMGYDVGVTKADLDELRVFYPKRRFV